MEALMINKTLFTWLCIYPCANVWEKYVKLFCCTVMFIIVIIVFISGLCFVYQFLSIDMGGTLFALVQIIGSIDLFYTLFFAYIFSDDIVAIFNRLQYIHSKCKSLEQYAIQIFR